MLISIVTNDNYGAATRGSHTVCQPALSVRAETTWRQAVHEQMLVLGYGMDSRFKATAWGCKDHGKT